MFTAARALAYASLFIAVVLVFLPAEVASLTGLGPPAGFGPVQAVGLALVTAGGSLAIACVITFALIGKGTPAPFDPPRRLVVRGPYRWVRNPMYIGATIALGGAALYYESAALAGYGLAFLGVTHVLVLLYEEPVLRRTFGREYEDYCRRVGRWWPRRGI